MKVILVLISALVLTSACPYTWLFGEDYQNDVDRRLELEQQSQSMKAADKQKIFWDKIVAAKYKALPTLAGSGLAGGFIATSKFALSSMTVPIKRVEDTMPKGRIKWIHPLGSCGKVKFVANDYSRDAYTGLFQGGDFGIARLSLATDPGSDNFTPGMAVKFFRDNQVSGNIISMFSLNGQKSNFNFFQNTFSNIVDEPSTFALQIAAFLTFRRASSCPTTLALGDFARYNQQGKYQGYLFPNQIYFEPVTDSQFPTANNRDFRNDLSSIKPGQKLYNVFTSLSTNGSRRQVGQLFADSEFIASDFCDNDLFFKHQNGEDIDCGK